MFIDLLNRLSSFRYYDIQYCYIIIDITYTNLIAAIMFHRPYTDGNGNYAYKDKWYEHQYPHMATGGQLVAYQQLKHKQY